MMYLGSEPCIIANHRTVAILVPLVVVRCYGVVEGDAFLAVHVLVSGSGMPLVYAMQAIAHNSPTPP